MINTEFKSQYVIVLVCLRNHIKYGLELGEEVFYKTYYENIDEQTFVEDINKATIFDSLYDVKAIAKRVKNRGDFEPKIYDINRNIGANIYIDFKL